MHYIFFPSSVMTQLAEGFLKIKSTEIVRANGNVSILKDLPSARKKKVISVFFAFSGALELTSFTLDSSQRSEIQAWKHI